MAGRPYLLTVVSTFATMLTVDDFESHAEKILSKSVLGFYKTGSYDDRTIQWNREAFQRYRLRPRVLRDVSCVSMETRLLGEQVDFPVGVSPTAFQCMAHPDGEQATARACLAVGSVMVASILSTKSMEEIARANGAGLRWQQIYLYRDRSLTRSFVRRAELAGFKAIVVTIDSPALPKKMGILRNYWSFPDHLDYANNPSERRDNVIIHNTFNPAATWDDIGWLRSITHLLIVVKGLLTGEDAELAVRSGVAAILVSNHGGRQLNTDVATLDALREVVRVVCGRVEVYMDGGVRRGTDVFKALAVGARAVFIGRPAIWGLAYKGQTGVQEVLHLLKEELKLAMMLSGCHSLAEIDHNRIVHESCCYSTSKL